MQSYLSPPSAPGGAHQKPSWLTRPLKMLGLGCLLALVQGCGDPCRDLSDSVCNCMPSLMDQQACRKRVRNLAAQSDKLSAAERHVCQDLMLTCSCEKLAQGDFSACGLAQD